jgi:hypothetical protein
MANELVFNPKIDYSGDWKLPVDLDKLWYAVSLHESGLPGKRYPCATEWHKKARNCVSVMEYSTGKRKLKQYATLEDGKKDFKRIWAKYYGNRVPTLEDAKRYSGNDDSYNWYSNVIRVYYSS